MKWPREEGSGQKSFVEPSVQCLLKPGLGWGLQPVWCQMLGLLRLQAQLTHCHMLLRERLLDDGKGDHSCLLHPLPLKLLGTRE